MTPVQALRFVELPDAVTTRHYPPALPAGDLFCSDLEERTRVLEHALSTAFIQLRVAECLGGTLPETPAAFACLDLLKVATRD